MDSCIKNRNMTTHEYQPVTRMPSWQDHKAGEHLSEPSKLLTSGNRIKLFLFELGIGMIILSIICGIAIPDYMNYRKKAAVSSVAESIQNFSSGFIAYSLEHNGFPDDCHLPPPYHLPNFEMENYLDRSVWADPTPLGGNYDWEGPDSHPYAAISIIGHTASKKTFKRLDALLDDGDLATGRFMVTDKGRYTYIIAY